MIYIFLLLGLVLRLISLNQSFWIDEATTGNVVRNLSLPEIIIKFAPGDFHPPLYYLTAKIWGNVFGTNEFALRLLSVVFAALTIYIVYKFSKLASLFLATSGLHIYYSQEARMYAMEAFLVSLAVYLFTKILHEKSRVGYWVAFAVILPLIFLTDYLPILILVPIWIVAIINKKNFSWWKKFLTSHIILVFSATWWFPTLLTQLNSGLKVQTLSPAWWQTLGATNLKEILLLPTKFIIGRISFDNKFVYALVAITALLTFGFLLFRARSSPRIFWYWLIIPVVIGAIIGFKISVFSYFRFLFVLPAFYVLVAIGVTNIKNKGLRVFLVYLILIINLVTSAIYIFTPKFHREDWKGLSIALTKNPSVDVVFPSNSQEEALRYYGLGSRIVAPNPNSTSIWLIRYAQPISDPSDTTRLKVENLGYKRDNEFDFNGVAVWEYK